MSEVMGTGAARAGRAAEARRRIGDERMMSDYY